MRLWIARVELGGDRRLSRCLHINSSSKASPGAGIS